MRRGGGENLDGGGVDLDGGARRRLDGGGVDLEMRRRGENGMRPRLGAAARLNLGRFCNGDGLKIQLPLPPVHLDRPDRKSTRLNSSHITRSRMPSSA